MELAHEYYQEENEVVETVMTDKQAEYYLRQIANETAETQRLINVCDTAISEYEFKKRCYQEKLEKKTAFLKDQLHNYFMTVNRKKTKTGESYELPSGKLKLKYSTPDYIRDNEKLVIFLENSEPLKHLIKIKKEPDWASLKKTTEIIGKNVVTAVTGEIIDGVTIQMKPETFEIEL